METLLRPGHPNTVSDAEQEDLQTLERLLNVENGSVPSIVASDGATMPLPPALAQLLHDVTHVLATENAIDLVPMPREATIAQAADFLDASKEEVEELIQEGRIAAIDDVRPRRIRLTDLIAFRNEEDAERRRALEDLIRLNQAIGLYDEP